MDALVQEAKQDPVPRRRMLYDLHYENRVNQTTSAAQPCRMWLGDSDLAGFVATRDRELLRRGCRRWPETTLDCGLVGPPGFEPGTKGFAYSACFQPARTISSPTKKTEGAGRSSLLSRALKPSGSLCTFRRCTAGLAQGCHRPNREGFPEFIPFPSAPCDAAAPFR
jgi:hypothetical protein